MGTLVGLGLGLASAGSALLAARHQMRSSELEREIVAVDVSAERSDSVSTLMALRARPSASVKLKWLNKGVLSTTKWRSIEALVEQRISLSRELHARSLAKEIEDIDNLVETDPAKARREHERIRNSIKKLFGAGEVDAEQCDFLLRLLPQ